MTTATARPAGGPQSRPQVHLQPPDPTRNQSNLIQNDSRKQPIDSTSDRATAAFIRRTLCAHQIHATTTEKGRSTPRPIEELLPPLTSSNEVDLQLYAFIAIIIKEFVYAWYAKITPDHAFVDEVIQTIAHCTRALEQRLRDVDLEALSLDEIPALIDAHVTAYRMAHEPANSPQLASRPRDVYHTLHPHPALSPVPHEDDPASVVEQEQNEAAWRLLLVQGVLAVLLPTEDLENACLRALVAEIFSEMIIGNAVAGRACEGWMVWDGVTKAVETIRPRNPKNTAAETTNTTPKDSLNRLEKYGLLSTSSDTVSAETDHSRAKGANSRADGLSVSSWFWLVIQYAFWACNAIRTLISAFAAAPSLPARGPAGTSNMSARSPTDAGGRQSQRLGSGAVSCETVPESGSAQRPIVSMAFWSCASRVIELHARMPWLSGLLGLSHQLMLAGPGRVGALNGALDRLLSHQLRTLILNPARLPPLLRATRATLFPSNALGPTRTIPSAAEQTRIKRRCAETIVDAMPSSVAATFYASRERELWVREVEGVLEVFRDPYLNRHLVFGILELVLVRVVPELGKQGTAELMAERLGEEWEGF